jgi:hypothetical protein
VIYFKREHIAKLPSANKLREEFVQQLAWNIYKRDLYKNELLKLSLLPKFIVNNRSKESLMKTSFSNEKRKKNKSLQLAHSMSGPSKSFLPVLVKK